TQSAGQAGIFAFTAPVLPGGQRQVVAIFSATAGPTVTDDLTLTIDTAGPRVSSSDGPQALAPLSTFAVHFDEPIDAATLTLADIGITGPGAIPIAATSITGAGADWVVHFAPQTAVGVYTVTVGPDVADLAGNAMNQDGDAANGESGADRFAGVVEIAPRIQVSWAGGGDGVSWSDPLNWGAHGLPGAGDDVVLDVPGVTVVYDLAASTIGSLVIAADTVLSLAGGTLGLLTASSVEGSLVLAGGSLDADEGLSVAAGGLVGGTGTIQGDLVNAGILRPGLSPGLLVITGDFFQAPNGVLQVEINGNQPGVSYDQVLVTGLASLAGTLDIRRDLLFDPGVFDRFEVLTYASVSGDFAAFTGRAIDTAKVFRPDRELTVYALTVDVNVPPTASPDLLVTLEDTPSPPLDVLVNDVDVDAEGPLEIIAFTQGAHGTVTRDVLGRFVYTPLPNAFGTDAFAYTVRDDVGAIDVASVTVTIDPVNDPPAAVDDVAQTIEATAVDIAVLANDADVDGDTLAVSELTQGQSGTVSANADGTLRYTPTAGFLGTDHFTYTVSDGAGGSDGAEVAVSVVAGNRPPVAGDDTAITGEDTTSASIDVLANDTDPDGDALSLAGFTHGAHGVVAPDAFGGLVYTPDPDFSGTDTFTYSVQDPDGLADEGQVTVTVTPSRDAPVAVDDVARTGRGTAVDVAVLANDVVDGPGGVIVAFTQGAHGQVIDLGGGVLRYLPAADFAGEDTFTYTMTDDLGPSDAAEVRLTVIDGMLWDGGGDGVSWGDRFNWLPDVLPTASDDVVIDLADADPIITVGLGQFAVRRLFSTEALTMAGGTLTFNADSEIDAALTFRRGHLAGTGDLTVTGPTTLAAEFDGALAAPLMSGLGTTTLLGDTTITINGNFAALELRGGRVLRLAGTATWLGGDIHVTGTPPGGPGGIEIAGGALLDLRGRHDLQADGGARLVNEGTIRKSPGTEQSTLAIGMDVNAGTIEVLGGVLVLDQGFVPSADSALVNQGTIRLAGGDLILSPVGTSGTFTNLGTVEIGTASTLTLNGTIRYVQAGGTTTLDGALDPLGQPNIFTTGPGEVEVRGGVLQGSGFIDADLIHIDGTIAPAGSSTGSLTVLGDYIVEAILGGTPTLSIEIAGTGPGEGHDQLAVLGQPLGSGVADLGGTLRVTLVTFAPALGQRFPIIVYGSAGADDFEAFEGLVGLDGRLAPSREAAEYVLIAAADRPPVANPDTAESFGGRPTAPIAVLANDTDPDPGDRLVIETFGNGAHGVVTRLGAEHLVYTPDPGFLGVDHFSYFVLDAGGLSAVTEVAVDVLAGLVDWDGGGDGADWNDPLNWSGDVLPGPTSHVIIDLAGATVTHASGVTSILSLNTFEALDLSGGSISVATTSTVRPAGALTIRGGATFGGAGLLTNQGVLSLAGGTLAAPLDNQGLLDVTQSTTLGNQGTTFASEGTIRIAAGQIFSVDGGSFAQLGGGVLTGGTYELAGAFAFQDAAITTLAATVVLDGPGGRIQDETGADALAGLATIAPAGSLTLRGGRDVTTTGPLQNDGTLALAVGSLFTVAGAFTQSDTGSLEIQIGGALVPGEDFGQLTATNAILAGRLAVQTGIGGFVPVAGDSFAVVVAGARSGTFAALDGAAQPNGTVLRAQYEPGAVVLVAEVPDVVSWDAGGDGLHWSDALNWSFDTLPGAGDQVVIEGPTSDLEFLVVQHDLADTAIGSLSMTGHAQLNLTAGLLTLAEASSIEDVLVLDGGALELEGELGVGGLRWTTGTVSGPGRLRLVAGGTGSIEGVGDKRLLGAQLTNDGSLTIDALLLAGDDAQIGNRGQLILMDDAAIREDTAAGGGASLHNDVDGRISRAANPQASEPRTAEIGIALESEGALDASNSELDFTASGVLAGATTATSGALRFRGGHYTLAPGAELLISRVLIESGELQVLVAPEAHQVFSYEISGGTLALDTAAELPLFGVTLSGGTLTGQADLALQGTMLWTGGTLTGTGAFTVRPGASLTLEGTGDRTLLGRVLTNQGTFTVDHAELGAGGGALIANAGGGTLLLLTDAILRRDPGLGGSASLLNAGTLVRESHDDPLATQIAGTVAQILMPLTSTAQGRIRVDHGILRLGDSGDVSGEVVINGHDDVGFGAGTLELAGTGYAFDAGSTVTDFIGSGPPAGEGTLRVTAGAQHLAGAFNVGVLVIDGGTLFVDRPGGILVGTLDQSAGELTGGTVTITEDLSWQGGVQSGPGATELAASARGVIRGTGEHILDGRALVNGGELFWVEGDIRVSGADITNLGTFDIASSPGQFGQVAGPGLLTSSPVPGFLEPVFDNQDRVLVGELGAGARISLPVRNAGSIELLPLSLLRLAGGLQQTEGGSVSGDGGVHFLAGDSAIGGGFAAESVVIGELGSAAHPTVTFEGGAAAAAAAGIWDVKTGALVIAGDGTDVQAGAGGVFVQPGARLALAGGTLRSDGGVEVRLGGLLEGAGTVVGAVFNDGTIRPGDPLGVLAIDGSFAQGPTGVLEVEIGGLTPDVEHDRLAVSGVTALGGTLAIVRVNGFVPQIGDTLDVVTHASTSGDFLVTTGTSISLDRQFTVTIDGDAVRLSVESAEGLPVGAVLAAINDGLGLFAGSSGLLGQWGSLFDLDSWSPDFSGFALPDFDLSVLTEALSTAFGLGGPSGRLAQLVLPSIDPGDAADGEIDTLEELVLSLQGIPGLRIDGVQGGIGGFGLPSLDTDILQATYVTSLGSLLASIEYNDSATALEHLATTSALDGLLDWLGNVRLDLSFGVDDQGFYMLGTTGLSLEVAPLGGFDPLAPPLSGQTDLGAVGGWQLGGGVLGDLGIGLTPGLQGFRFRPFDLALPATDYLVPTADGALTLSLRAERPGFTFDWDGTYGFALDGLAVSTDLSATLTGRLALPELTLPGETEPAALELAGTLAGNVWTLALAQGSPTAFDLAGFTLTGVSAGATIATDQFAGTFEATVEVPLCADEPPVALAVDASFDTSALHLAATAPLESCFIGDPAVLWIRQGQAELDLGIDFGTFAITPDSGVTVTADLAVLLPESGPLGPGQVPDGLATATGLSGAVDGAGNLDLTFETLDADANGVAHLHAESGGIVAGPDAGGAPLASVATAQIVFTLLDSPVELTVSTLALDRAGNLTFAGATLRGDDLLDTFGLGRILPVDLTEVALSGVNGDPVRLDRFRLDVTGSLEFSILDFAGQAGLAPTVDIGGLSLTESDAELSLGFVFVDGDLTVDLDGLVVLGLAGMTFGPLTAGVTLELGEFVDGHYVFDAVEVDVAVSGGAPVNPALTVQARLDLDSPAPGQTTLDVAATFTTSFGTDLVEVVGAEVSLGLLLTLGPDFTVLASELTLAGVSVDEVVVHFGDVLTFRSTDVVFDFDARGPELFATFGSMSATIDGVPGLPTGTVENFGIGADFSLQRLSGFTVLFEVPPPPDGPALDLVWLTVGITGLGVELGDRALTGEDPTDIVLILSGGLFPGEGETPWPLTATVTGLRLNLGRLADGDILGAVEGIDGGLIGVEPFTLGPVTIGGALGLEVVRGDQGESALVARVQGHFEVAGIGGSIGLIITEFGPLAASLGVPLAVPLGPTGLILTGVTGGFTFGLPEFDTPPSPEALLQPAVLARLDFDPQSFSGTPLRNAILAFLDGAHDVTWELPFRLSLRGDVTTAATPGILEGHLTLALEADPADLLGSVKLLAAGEITGQVPLGEEPDGGAFGIPLGAVGAVFDLSEPFAPHYQLAFAAPAPGNPFSFLFPAEATYTVDIDTKGMVEATAIGLKAFVSVLRDEIAQGVGEAQQVVDRLVAALADQSRPLVGLLGLPAGTPLTAQLLLDRLADLLPGTPGANPNPDATTLAELGDLVSAVMSELFQAASQALRTVSGELDVARAAAFLEHFADTLGAATRTALHDGFAAFDPRLAITGSLTPLFLGIPFGEALVAGSIAIDKDGVAVGFEGSMQRLAGEVAGLVGPFGIGEFFVKLFALGFEDQFRFDFKLGLGGVFESLLAGNGLPEVSPFGDWVGGFSGQIRWLGVELAGVSGFFFSPASAEVADHVIVVPATGPDEFPAIVPPLDADGNLNDTLKIPITADRLLDLQEFGGLIATAQLFAPALLLDPLALFEDIATSPALQPPTIQGPLDLFDFGPFIGNVANALMASQEFGRLQLYIPTFGPGLGPQAMQDRLERAYLSGFVGGREPGSQAGGDFTLFSMPIGKLALDIDGEGNLVARGEVPFLADAEVTATLDFRGVNLNELVEDVLDGLGIRINGQRIELSNGGTEPVLLPMPRAHLEASLSASRLQRFLVERLGLPGGIFNPSRDFEASLEIFSPLFGDPEDPSLPAVERNGGVIVDAHLNIDPIVRDASFHFESVLFGDGVSPEFTAQGRVDLRVPGFGDVSNDIFRAVFDAELALQDGDLTLTFGDFDPSDGFDAGVRVLDLLTLSAGGTLAVSADGVSGVLGTSVRAGGLANDIFSLSAGFAVEINTTDRAQSPGTATIPAGPYLGLHAEGALSILDAITFDALMDLVFTDEGFTVEGAGHLGIPIADLDIDVEGRLYVIDGRVEGRFTADGLVVTLDRWGCLTVNGVDIIDLLPEFLGDVFCDQQVYVDNQRFRETDAARTREIVIRLAQPASRDLRVNYTLDGAGEGSDWAGSDGHIVIAAGKSSGKVSFTVLGDNEQEDDERFTITITDAFYVDDDGNRSEDPTAFVADPLSGDWDARITIEDDEGAPAVVIEAGGAVDGETILDGARHIFAGSLTEGDSGSLVLRAENLGVGQSVQVHYTLVPATPSRTTAALGDDFFAGATGQGIEGILTLTGAAPEQAINVVTVGDSVYELHESFEILLDIVAFTTDGEPLLPADLARMTVQNDDSDRPPGALVFYDLDAIDPLGAGDDPYRYDQGPDYTDPLVRATPFVHRDDAPNFAASFTLDNESVFLFAGAGPRIPSSDFTIDFWVRPGEQAGGGRASILAIPGVDTEGSRSIGFIGLSIFLEGGFAKYEVRNAAGTVSTHTIGRLDAGEWHHVALVYGLPTALGDAVIGTVDGAATLLEFSPGAADFNGESLMLGQALYVDGTLHVVPGFVGDLDELRVWSTALGLDAAPGLSTLDTTGAEANLLVQLRFDEGRGLAAANIAGPGWAGELGNRLPYNVTPGVNFGPAGRPEWRIESGSPVGERPRYDNVSIEDPDGFPKVEPVLPVSDPTSAIQASGWAAPGTPIEVAPYYTFVVGRDGSSAPGGIFDIRQIAALHIDGVDFFHRPAADGPTRWELRSSLDQFTTVLAEGATAPGEDYLHQRVIFEESLFPIHPGQNVEFRLYGLDAPGAGAWTVDNFALIAGVVPPILFDRGPIGEDFFFTTVPGSPSAPIDPTAGASDPDGDPVGVIDVVLPPGVGTLVQNVNGTFTFTRAIGVAGDIPLVFTLADHWGLTTEVTGVATFAFDAVNDAFTINEDTTLNGSVVGNDQLVPGTTVSLVGAPPPSQAFVLRPDGTFTFTPIQDSVAPVSFGYAITAGGVTDQAAVSITLGAVNDAPIGAPDRFQVDAGKTLSVSRPGVLGSDRDVDNPTLQALLGRTASNGTLALAADGSFTYTPRTGFSGTDAFTYFATDGTAKSGETLVTIQVIRPNQPPDAVSDGPFTVAEDGTLIIPISTLLANDRDPEGSPVAFKSVGTAQHGRTATGTQPLTGAPAIFYRPASNFNGTDSFTYVIADSAGLLDTATVTITVSPVNDAPVAVNDTFVIDTRLQSQLVVAAPGVRVNDFDIEGDAISAQLVGQTQAGSVTGFSAAGGFTYTPGAGFTGQDFFSYRLFDAQVGISATATVTIFVIRTLPPPVVQPPPTTSPVTQPGTVVVAPRLTLNGYIAG
ncbi:MAG TPA: Ig-like domain-containing protein, partial [Candidatus Limnocylindrales bacterium]|nr:Ig-like domain-containing protein [Candidatus Limnocylindrales bacterium]